MPYLFSVLPVLSFVLALILGLIVFFKNFRNRTNQVFSAISFFIAFWIFCVFMADTSAKIANALFWSKMAIIGPALIFPLFLWFSLIFPSQKFPISSTKTILMFLPSVLILILVPTKLNVEKVTITEWGTDFTPGFLYLFLLALLFGFMGAGFYNLGRNYKKAQGIDKARIKYFFLGTMITLILGMLANLILPLCGYGEASVFGPSSAIFFILFTTLAITRYHLFDIRVILSEILVGIIALILFIQTLVADPLWLKLLNGAVFILFCVFGYFLVKATIKEINLRKEIEKLSNTKSEFISIASHQLRTPLTAVKGYISMILEGSYNVFALINCRKIKI